MPQKSALSLALEALDLGAECGGENDQEIYLEAKQKLENVIRMLVEHDAEMVRAERSPDGDDYNRLRSILEIE